MITTFVNRDVRNIFENIFNSNDYDIEIKNEDLGTSVMGSMKDFLNVQFYSWKNRVVDIDAENQYISFGDWIKSISESLNQSYCLIELVNETCQTSKDIDNGILDCKATFIINSNKINQLEDYIAQLRGKYKGNVQDIKNEYGRNLKAYIYVGALIPKEDPMDSQLGEVIICECGFSISYLLDATSYADESVQISFDGQTFEDILVSKDTHQVLFQTQANPRANRPDVSGQIQTSATRVQTLTFYCFKGKIMSQLTEFFYKQCAYKIWDSVGEQYVDAPRQNLNIPVYIKIEYNEGNKKKGFIYEDTINQLERVRENSDFTLMSITLGTRGYGSIV